MRIVSQSIPSELLALYEGALAATYNWKDEDIARKRSPFHIPTSQGGINIDGPTKNGGRVSAAQILQRQVFVNAVHCFNKQPKTGGVVPPNIGPRNRSWWYNASLTSGLWYYNYFMQQTINAILGGDIPDWCKVFVQEYSNISSVSPSNTGYKRTPIILQNNGSNEWQIWAKKPNFTPRYLLLYLRSFFKSGAEPAKFKIEVYEAGANIDYATLTWNTKPLTSSLIGSIEGTPVTDDYIVIPCPTIKNACVKLIYDIDNGYNVNFMIIEGAFASQNIKPVWL